MELQELDAGNLGLGSGRAYRFVRRLAWLYGSVALLVAGALVLLPFLPAPVLRAQAAEAMASGGGGLVLGTLLMTVTALCATIALTAARYAYRPYEDDSAAGLPPASRFSLRGIEPGVMARQGQALIVALGAALTCYASWLLWPVAQSMPVAMSSPNVLGAIAVALAFASLIAERAMAEFPAPQMPEAPALRRLLLVTTVLLAAAGALEIGRGAGVGFTYWLFFALSIVPWVVALELTVRALARLFLPPPRAADARAVVDSIFLGLITGGPRAPGVLLRDHLGLDFSRSWALSYLLSAALPAVVATALLCWGLSGLKLINLDQRGIYERFGAPVAVLGPGIHLLLPWPIGVMRLQELGTLHEIKVGSTRPETGADGFGAEAVPPASSNHLWDTADPAEAQYLVASQSGSGAQGFQVVDAEIHVVYRTGLTDADAMAATYSAADPQALISGSASRIAALYFASHTLDLVMGAQRDALAEFLRTSLARDIAAYRAGIEIVSVHIESVHPPAGAAAAYHAVQAAEINAKASVFNETGRAKRVSGVAEQEAHQLTEAAQGGAAERTFEAKGEAYRFAADRKAYALSPAAFVTERTFSQLAAALSQVQLTIVDSRISPAQSPIIDLRGGEPGSSAKPAAPLTPGVEENQE